MEGQLKDVEANVTRTNVMSIESGQQVEKSQKQQEYVTASAHAVDKGQCRTLFFFPFSSVAEK